MHPLGQFIFASAQSTKQNALLSFQLFSGLLQVWAVELPDLLALGISTAHGICVYFASYIIPVQIIVIVD